MLEMQAMIKHHIVKNTVQLLLDFDIWDLKYQDRSEEITRFCKSFKITTDLTFTKYNVLALQMRDCETETLFQNELKNIFGIYRITFQLCYCPD